jgi:hypothetical protein
MHGRNGYGSPAGVIDDKRQCEAADAAWEALMKL